MKARIKAAWDWIKANKGLVARVVAIVVVAGNQVAATVGVAHTGATEDQVYAIASSVITIAAMGAGAWKNFNFTDAAQTAQSVLDALKDGKITADEVESLLAGITKVAEAGEGDAADVTDIATTTTEVSA